ERHEVRAFADRGTWRFRTQDIEEMARRRGLGSSPELPLGEAPRPRPHDSPAPKSDPSVFEFKLGASEQVEIGQELPRPGSKSGRKASSRSKVTGSKSGVHRGADSDVRLVSDGTELAFRVPPESGVKSGERVTPQPRSGSGVRQGPRTDSGEKLVPD